MAAKFADILEDAIPDSGDSMSLKSNEAAVSAKDRLRKFGFAPKEIEDIASAHGQNVDQAAEIAERFSELNLGKYQLYRLLIKGEEITQDKVQEQIKKAVSIEDSSDEQSGFVTNKGRQLSNSSSNSASDTSLQDLKELDIVVERDLPGHLKEGQFDIFLLFCEDDEYEAIKFKYFLEKELDMKVCFIGNNVVEKRNQFDQLEDAIDRSLYTFIFVTEKMIGDFMLKYKHDAALVSSINTNGEFVVPVRGENCKIPFSLQPLTALRVYHIMDELPQDPHFLREGESERPIDWTSNAAKQIPFVKNQIVKLVRAKERLKKRREQMDEQKKKEWIEDEKIKKYKEAKENELREEKRALRESLEMEMIKEEIAKSRANMEQEIRQEIEEKKKQQQGIDLTTPMHRQLDMKDYLQFQAFWNAGFAPYVAPGMNPALATQFPIPSFAPVHYHLPTGVNPSDLVPRPTLNVQVQQLQNLQMGDGNQLVYETMPPLNDNSPMTQAPDPRPPPTWPENLPAQSQVLGQPASIASKKSRDHLIPEQVNSAQHELGPDSEEGTGLPSTERQLFDPINETRPTLEEGDQTLVKRQLSVESSAVASSPLNQQLQEAPDISDESMVAMSTGYTTGTGSEFGPMSLSEGRPGALLGFPSTHHYGSAVEHLSHPPGEHSAVNCEARNRNPLSLIEPPGAVLDNALSIRSQPDIIESNQLPTLSSAESQFQRSMNQSQASVNIS